VFLHPSGFEPEQGIENIVRITTEKRSRQPHNPVCTRREGGRQESLIPSFALAEGELKETKSGSNPLPLAQAVLEVLRLWREHTPYRSNEDWIFASLHYHGKTPYTCQILFRRHIRPVIERVSVTTATHHSEETLELYAQAVSADQQKAHKKVVRMVLPLKFPERLKARSAQPATIVGLPISQRNRERLLMANFRGAWGAQLQHVATGVNVLKSW
jgi:hypothetical protein